MVQAKRGSTVVPEIKCFMDKDSRHCRKKHCAKTDSLLYETG